MSMNLRPEAQELLERVSNFLENEVAPNEAKFHEQIKTDENRWNYFPEIVEELKDKARDQHYKNGSNWKNGRDCNSPIDDRQPGNQGTQNTALDVCLPEG